MLSAHDVIRMSRREFAELLACGHPVEVAALEDRELKGTALGLPRFIEALTWKKFRKVFHRDPATGVLRGWNVRLEQNGLGAPDVPQLRQGLPRTFGHYEVVPLAGYKIPRRCGPGLMLDYGRGGNPWWDPTALMRDPIVAVNAGSSALLLGWSYLDLGIGCIGTPSFFCLERDIPLSHRVKRPRPA